MDSTICEEIPEDEQLDGGITTTLMPIIEKLGLAPFAIRSEYGEFLEKIPERQREQAILMMSKTVGAAAVNDEMDKIDQNIDHVWREMETTDIPKICISASCTYHTKEDFIKDGIPAKSLVSIWVDPSMKDAGEDAIYEEALRMMEQIRTERENPYYEKLGNCKVAELPGDHVIFLDKPDECSKIIKEFIDKLDG